MATNTITDIRQAIINNSTALGIELGSTRIKAVLIDSNHSPIATGSHDWENRYENGVWTYHLDDVWTGLQSCYAKLAADVREKYDVPLRSVGAIGVSAMMHGYLAFDRDDVLLVPFRTWRNTMTAQAVKALTELFQFSIPQRWSIAHLYQAIQNGEPHVKDISYLTTLAGYVHWQLTGQKVVGVGDASGMFPIDSAANNFDKRMLERFDGQIADKSFPWQISAILPRVLAAGEAAGTLTESGARLIDPSGTLAAGIPLCPPEGDAGTGMIATNSIKERTGNVSTGTSIFAMIVLEKALSRVYPDIDMVTTPAGKPVAMVHCNNCASDLDAWVGLFGEFAQRAGAKLDKTALYGLLYQNALTGDADCGGLLAYNYLSGEHITSLSEGRPLFTRTPDSRFTLANFMRAHLFSALCTLKLGLNILFEQEHVSIDQLLGHGGFLKTPVVGQRLMAAATGVPVAVMETAGEGGPWGMALLAGYMIDKQEKTLEDYLADIVFAGQAGTRITPDPADTAGFAAYLERYKAGLTIERAAVEAI